MENIDTNHIRTIGANAKANLWVPTCCSANKPTSTTQAITRTWPVKERTQ